MEGPWTKILLGEVLVYFKKPINAEDGNKLPVWGVTNIDGVTNTGARSSSDRSKYLYIEPGCFVYNPYRINVGSIGLANEEHIGIVSPAYVVFKTQEALLKKYLWYYLKSSTGNMLINYHGNRGSVRSALRFKDLCNIPINLPSIAEQKLIVAKIETFAKKLHNIEGVLNRIKQEQASLCNSIFKSDTTIETPMHDLVTLKEASIKVSPLEKYSFAGIYCFGRGMFKGGTKNGMEFSYKKLSQLETGDFVYPKLMAWEGALSIVPPECNALCVSTEFPVFKANTKKLLPETLDVYFKNPSVWPKLAEMSSGTNARRRRLNPKSFLKFMFPLPSMKTQLRLKSVKHKLDQVLRIQENSKKQLDALMPSILDKAFNGEL